MTQVRFLPPQPYGRASQLAMAPRSNRDELHGLEGSTPSLSATQHVPLADRQRHQPSKLARRVRLPQGTLMYGSVAQRQSGCLLSTGAWVRVPPVPLRLRGSFCR